jgi:hypothetical protein
VLQRFRGELTLLDGRKDEGSSVREQTIARSPQAPARQSAPIDDDVPF